LTGEVAFGFSQTSQWIKEFFRVITVTAACHIEISCREEKM